MAEETEAILAAYEMPSGTLDVARVEQIAERVQARLEELDVAWLPALMSRVLVRLRQRFDAGSLPPDPAAPADSDRAEVTAVVDLSHVCAGWSDPPGPPSATDSGSIQLTAVIEDTRLRRELWGTATECLWRLDPIGATALSPVLDPAVNVLLDGTLILFLYGPLPRTPSQADFFLSFTGELGRQERVRPLSFDFRVIDGQIELRHTVDDGDIVVGLSLTRFTLRGQNASITCDRPNLSCY